MYVFEHLGSEAGAPAYVTGRTRDGDVFGTDGRGERDHNANSEKRRSLTLIDRRIKR